MIRALILKNIKQYGTVGGPVLWLRIFRKETPIARGHPPERGKYL